MDIFKLFFEHDLRLDQLASPTSDGPTMSLDDFMKPVPTYSKFYLTGTWLEEKKFCLSALQHYEDLVGKLEDVFSDYRFFTDKGNFPTLKEALSISEIGEAIVLSTANKIGLIPSTLSIDQDSNIGHRKDELSSALKRSLMVLYKEQAPNGFDIHLLSKKNIYPQLFSPLKKLLSDRFRFFSINSKRISSERQFYFETWRLHRPPHGAEEVFPETKV